MANIIPLKDSTGAQFYPQTHEKAVVDSNGVNLQTKLASITTPTYVTAWDGDSTPVVANIPSGVTVTYGGTTYTGTLAASASTANKTYLVSTGTTDNYNRYVTQLNGSTYSWQNIGSTEIDLSDYATKEELGQLDQIVDNIYSTTENIIELQDATVSVVDATVKTYSAGRIQITGTASKNGGRTTKLCTPFSLPAGSYRLVISNTISAQPFVETTSGDTIIAQLSSPNFTLNSATSVYIGVNLVSGRTYSDDFGIAIYADQTKTDYVPTITAKDSIAREQAAKVEKLPGIESRLLNNFFVGAGATFASVNIRGLKAGVPYRIVLQNPANLTATTSDMSLTKFGIGYDKSDGTSGQLLAVRSDAVVAGAYSFTIPDDFKNDGNVGIGGRAVAGTIINFYIIEDNADSLTVKQYNIDKESAIASAASRTPLVYEKTNNNQCPVFSILTDIHSDALRFKRACEFADNEDAVLATFSLGDLIQTSESENPYPLILNFTKPVISITGNHEVLKKTSQGVSGWSESDILNNIYNSDQIEHNGETHPTGKCYWYKDFSKTIDGSTKTLRVIGLHQYESNGTGEQNTGAGKDVTFYTQAQIDWLISTLAECDANTYVMILVHYAPTPNMTRIECPFTPSASFGFPIVGGSDTGGPTSMSDNDFIPKIVQAWIDGTPLNISCDITVGENTTTITAVKQTAFTAHSAKFVGYFSGHIHRDFVGQLTNYPKQRQFSFMTASATSAQQIGDIGRETSGKSQDCFTIVGVDWFQNSVSLVRIGADITTDMRERKWYNIPIPV